MINSKNVLVTDDFDVIKETEKIKTIKDPLDKLIIKKGNPHRQLRQDCRDGKVSRDKCQSGYHLEFYCSFSNSCSYRFYVGVKVWTDILQYGFYARSYSLCFDSNRWYWKYPRSSIRRIFNRIDPDLLYWFSSSWLDYV